MDNNKLKEIRKKIVKAEKIPIIGKTLKRYYRKQLFKELDKIIENKRKEEVDDFFRNFANNFIGDDDFKVVK